MSVRSNRLPCVVVAVLAGLVAANALRPAYDHDTWWHLRIGQFVAETGRVPRVDPISRLGLEDGRPWQAYSWLYEWLLFQSHSFGAVLWFRAVLVAGSTAAVLGYLVVRQGTSLGAMALAVGATVPLVPMATERPWHLTMIFTVLVLAAVQSLRDGGPFRRSLWLLPLFALWANLHIQFVLGWLILGLACLDPCRANRRRVIALALGCALTTLANPYHVQLVSVIWDYATQAAPRAIIYELAPPRLMAPWTLATLALVGWAVVDLVRRRSTSVFDWGLLVAGAILASRMNRDLWFGALVAAAVVAVPSNPARLRPYAIVATIVATVLALRVMNSIGVWGDNSTEAANARVFPVRAVAFLREARPPGPLFNDLTWGGYLAWAAPEYPVTIDGRTNLYGSERLAQSSRTWSTADGWKDDAELAKCNVILAQKGRAFTPILHELDWQAIYEDEIAVIFVRR